jgi:hypothetical protein
LFELATVKADIESLPGLFAPVSRPRLLDRQGWSTCFASALLLLISFTTNYGDDNLLQFGNLPATHKVGICLHLAALAALAGDVQLASRLRHRAGALSLLEPSPLHRQFLAYIANELAGPPQGEQVG